MRPSYTERALGPLAVLWHRTVGAEPEHTRILPDGCLDLIWDGSHLVVAGPDPAARWHSSAPGTRFVGLRLFGGVGATAIGVSAVELLGRSVTADEVLPEPTVRLLVDRMNEAPEAALGGWLHQHEPSHDRTGPRVLAMAHAGLSATAMADELGCSPRQLHRRCLPLFGYGPRRLGRIVRLQAALARMRAGTPLAEAAAASGYADQPHLTREVRALTGTTPTALVGRVPAPGQAAFGA